jgi:cyanate permease
MPKRFGFRGWWIVGVVLVAQGIALGPFITFSLFIPPVVEDFGMSRMTANLGISIMTVVMTLVGPFVGALLDRRSIRGLMVAGAVLNVLSFLAISRATEVWQLGLVLGIGLAGGTAMLGPLAGTTVVAKWFDRLRGRAVGIAAVGPPLMGLLIAPLAGALIESVGWRTTLLYYAAATLFVIPPVWLVIRNRPEDVGQLPDGADPGEVRGQPFVGEEPSASLSPGTLEWTTPRIFRAANFWALALGMGLVFGIGGGWNANVIPFLQDLGFSIQEGSVLLAIGAGMAVPGTLLFGALADRFDNRMLLWISIALQIVCFFALRTEPGYAVLVATMLVFGLSAGGLLPVYASVVGKAFGPLSFGTVMGLGGLVMLPFAAAAPPIAGGIRDVTGSYGPALVIFMASFLVAAAILLGLRLPRSAAVSADATSELSAEVSSS